MVPLVYIYKVCYAITCKTYERPELELTALNKPIKQLLGIERDPRDDIVR